MSKRKKAPAGCYWRGATISARVKINGQERRWSLETNDPKLATTRRQAGKARIVADARHGDASRGFEETFEQWATHIERTVAAKTVTRYLVSLNQLSPWLEAKGLGDVDGRLVATMARERAASGVANATIKRDLVALSSVMNFALDQGWIEHNPVLARMKRVKEQRDPIVLPRPQDIELVAARAPGMIRDMIAAAMATGAREAELLTARRDHINHERRQLTLHGKGNKTRTISLEPFNGYDLLRALPAYVGSPLLFWHSSGESYKNFASQFSAIIDRTAAWAKEAAADFRPFRFHDLRHWHAVEFLKRRVGSIYELQHRLGHASVKTTEGYLRAGYLTHDEVQAAVNGVPVAQIAAQHAFSGTATG